MSGRASEQRARKTKIREKKMDRISPKIGNEVFVNREM